VRMARHRDIDRFNRWAKTYDRHWMQRLIFGRVQEMTLQLAALEVARPTAILDVGCGTGRLLRSAAVRFPGARLVGVDAANEMVRQAEASTPAGIAMEFQQAIAEELPFPNAQFDLVFSTVTFHHWRDQDKGIAEVARVLAPGGRWLLADFIAAGLMRYVRRLLGLRQFPERGDVDGMLAAGGLGVVAERRVPGLGGQVIALAIGAKT